MHMRNFCLALTSQKAEEELTGFNSGSKKNPDPPKSQDALGCFLFTPCPIYQQLYEQFLQLWKTTKKFKNLDNKRRKRYCYWEETWALDKGIFGHWAPYWEKWARDWGQREEEVGLYNCFLETTDLVWTVELICVPIKTGMYCCRRAAAWSSRHSLVWSQMFGILQHIGEAVMMVLTFFGNIYHLSRDVEGKKFGWNYHNFM